MDCDRPTQKDQYYPYLVPVSKCIVFAILATLVLYLPLGDPHSAQSTDKTTAFGAGCCLCDLYGYLFWMYIKMSEIIQYLVDVMKDVLYDTKIHFYGLLHKVDGKDLCRNACMEEWEEEMNSDEPDQRRRPACRCIKKKCCRKLE